MSERKPFRRVKVSNRGYCVGCRQQFKTRPKSQTSVNLAKKELSGATNTEQLKQTQQNN